MLNLLELKEVAIIAAKKETKKKVCPVCKKTKSIATGFYKSSSPLFALDGCVPICIDCVKKEVVNEDGTVNENKLKTMCQRLDKPFYTDELDSAFLQVKSEHGYLSDDEVAKQGNKIVGFFFKNINTLRQNKDKSFADSERDGFSHKTYNVNAREKKERIANRYGDVIENTNSSSITTSTQQTKKVEEELVYSEFWMGEYSQKDIDLLDKYYAGLNRDYKIVTENHRDYAKKIAKASLMMDKAYEDMLKGVTGADKMYSSAKDIFDSLSKSAKFSEDKRSINDVGISSFSKITSIVENHNWIPQHVPKEKDMYDEMLEALSVINKSV